MIPAGEYRPSSETANWALAVDGRLGRARARAPRRGHAVPGGRCASRSGCSAASASWSTTAPCDRVRPAAGRARPRDRRGRRNGGRWWLELFFLGRSLQLRDADGHRLLPRVVALGRADPRPRSSKRSGGEPALVDSPLRGAALLGRRRSVSCRAARVARRRAARRSRRSRRATPGPSGASGTPTGSGACSTPATRGCTGRRSTAAAARRRPSS